MHLHRLRVGEITAAIGAVVLLASLFFDWVGLGDAAAPAPAGLAQDGWSGAGIILVLLLVAVGALALTLVVLTVSVEPVGMTISAAVATAFVGIVATIATLLRLTLFQPDLGLGVGDSAVDIEFGAYLGLVGVLLCAAGGWLTLRDERTEAPYSAAPELEPRPAPKAASQTGPDGLA